MILAKNQPYLPDIAPTSVSEVESGGLACQCFVKVQCSLVETGSHVLSRNVLYDCLFTCFLTRLIFVESGFHMFCSRLLLL